jgi:hypothetical protein
MVFLRTEIVLSRQMQGLLYEVTYWAVAPHIAVCLGGKVIIPDTTYICLRSNCKLGPGNFRANDPVPITTRLGHLHFNVPHSKQGGSVARG